MRTSTETHTDPQRYDWVAAAEAAGINLVELAARTCVSYALVYRMAKGSRRPTEEWLATAMRVIRNGPWPKEGGC